MRKFQESKKGNSLQEVRNGLHGLWFSKVYTLSFYCNSSSFIFILAFRLPFFLLLLLLLLGRGRGRKVQASPRHGLGLLCGYLNLGGHHVHDAFTHIDHLQGEGSVWQKWLSAFGRKVIVHKNKTGVSFEQLRVMFGVCSRSGWTVYQTYSTDLQNVPRVVFVREMN